ncbi:MAG: hypothetical protein ACI89X_000336 [Planctomycetota bacterium]|jgi:hypothetical protein
MSMTDRGGARRSWWWLACLFASCVQPRDQQPGGTFGHSRSDLFSDPVGSASEQAGTAQLNTAQLNTAQLNTGQLNTGQLNTGQLNTGQLGTSALVNPRVAGSGLAATPAENADRTEPAMAAAPTSAAATPATPSPAEASAPKRGRSERHLRNAFANADTKGATQATLDLAGYLVQKERHFDALFVVDTALKRDYSVPLRLARAGLLRDVARCDLAASELQAVVHQLGAKKVSPATLFDLVQMQWVAGYGESAIATLRSIRQVHAGDPWLRDHATEIADWDRRIHEVAPGRDPLANGELRDLLALLRAAPQAAGRLKILNTLAVPPKVGLANRAADDARRPVRVRAIAIACADESTAVRARAVSLATANRLTDENFWQVALTDPAPLVRRFAATGAAQQHGRDSVPMLFQAIRREQEEQAFQSMHAALAVALEVTAPTCMAKTEAGRLHAIAHWRSLCEH